MMLKIPKGAKIAAALMCGAGLTLAVPMLPAVGQSSPPAAAVRLRSPAQIADQGAVVFVTVRFHCPARDQPSVQVQLTERSGNSIAQGFGNTFGPVACTGRLQQVIIAVTPQNAPFVPGVAFGQVQIVDCPPFLGCVGAADQRSISLVKQKAKV